MADNIVGGLFGVTPEMFQAQQVAQVDKEAADFIKNYGNQEAILGYKLGNVISKGLGGLMGNQDPEVQRFQQRQQLMQGVNINDPQSLLKAAQEANAAGDTPAAQDLYGKYQAAIKNIAEAGKTVAETQAKQAEAASKLFAMSPKGLAQELAKTGNFTTESITKYVAGTGQLERIDKLAKPTSDFVSKAVELGFGDKPAYGQYTPDQTAQVNAALLEEQRGLKAAGAPKISSITQQENAFGKNRGESQAKLLDTATATAQGASSALNRLNAMEEKNKAGTLYSGPQANAVLESANFLSSVGLLSPEQAKSLTDSTVYSKLAKDLVIQDLGGKLGAQVSNTDRDYIEARIPQLTTNPKARTELIQKLKEINKGKIEVYRKMNEHANKFGNLNDFDFSQDYVPFVPKVSSTSSSDADLIGKYLKPKTK